MPSVTAVVLAKNEENFIPGCLASLSWCDEVLVLDSVSSDRTVEIARSMGAAVVLRPFSDFADQRNAAIDIVTSDWIFFVDADERVPEPLADEARAAIALPEFDGWWIPTRNNYFGKWLKSGGFYPDYHLRLARTEKLHYDPTLKVHERPVLDGTAGYLVNPLVHICYQSLGELREAKARYASLLAETHYGKGVRPTYHLLAAPVLTFFEQLFVRKGYRDGWVGVLISLLWAYYAFDEYRRLLLLWVGGARRTTEAPSTGHV